MTTTIMPLGINGYMPSYGRHTMSILVIKPPHAIIFDAGSGIARLLEEKVKMLLSQCTDLHILLSHYHLDHVMGLFFLPGIWSKQPVHIYAPTFPYIGVNPKDVIKKLLEPPLSSDFEPPPIEELFTIIGIHGSSIAIGGFDIWVKPQKHPGGSLAFRLTDEFVYATDTKPDSDTAEFAKGTKLLFHDVYLGDEGIAGDSTDAAAHSSLKSAIDLARMANAERLVPIHFNPLWEPGKVKDLQKTSYSMGANVSWPVEGELLV